jgi:thymidylate synthase (FAD)
VTELDLQFRDAVEVDLVQDNLSDESVAWAARVSTVGERAGDLTEASPERTRGLIRFLMRDRHGTPYEHGSVTFRVTAPRFVGREMLRHRAGVSFNEESGRYRKYDPAFYVPGEGRPLVQVGKPGAYSFEEGDDWQSEVVDEVYRDVCWRAWKGYQRMLDAGVAREVARGVLPETLFSTMYVTMNARALMHFLSLRTRDPRAQYPSGPQYEIELVALQMEDIFAKKMPLTYEAFNDFGRVAP